jgi:RNA polymerase sporulation-specific sigma factor
MHEENAKDIVLAQDNDKDALQRLVQNNSGLVWNIVKRFIGRGHELEDLYQIGCIGFIKAIKRFDATFEVQLSTYAVPYILGEIKRFIRDDGMIKVSRSIKELATRINELQREHQNKYGQELTISKITKALQVSEEDVNLALESVVPVDSINKEEYGTNGENKIDKIRSDTGLEK